MSTFSTDQFHQLHGTKKQRMTYQDKDFLDYALMLALCALAAGAAYGGSHPLAIAAYLLCAFTLAMFVRRHGARLKMPLILRQPAEVAYLVLHKLQNIRGPWVLALALLLAENLFVHLTPQLPHKVELMHTLALWAFGAHFALITVYRTAIFIAHLRKRELVGEILMQSVWRTRLEKTNVTLEIVHAYATGMLTHIVFLAPWFMVISYSRFSVLALPVTVVAAALIQQRFAKRVADWFYRDHWLGHNSELDFVYLHGPHHDAIPSGLIAVAGNGYLEGYLRGLVGFPTPLLNPFMAALFYTIDVKIDIDSHQFIPGVYPQQPREFYQVTQHSTHHFGRLEPYGFAINLAVPGISERTRKMFKLLPDELKYSIRQDEQLTGYEWDNERHRWFLALVDKYHTDLEGKPAVAGAVADAKPLDDVMTGS